jgi:peroxin-5
MIFRATYANSNDASKAIEAYFTALEIKPDYIRARYNLSIACIQTGQYSEAAEHLLGALSIQQNDISQIQETTKNNVVIHIGDGQSANVWQTLRLLMDTYIRRSDLVEACDAKDLSAFRKDFDF